MPDGVFDTSAAVDLSQGQPPRVVFGPSGFDVTSFGHWGFGLTVSRTWDSGLRSAPLCGPGRSRNVFWRAHAETSRKIVTCVVARALLTPLLPHCDTGDPNDVLLSREVSLPSRERMGDGSEMIVVALRLVFGQQVAPDVNDTIFYPNSALNVAAPLQLDPKAWLKLFYGAINPPAEAADIAPVTF